MACGMLDQNLSCVSYAYRKRRLTLAPQRVPRLDSEEHTQLVASLTNMSATLPASAIDGVDGKLG